MEQVLNAKERNEAFIKFILFFLITVAVIVGAVYFDALLPDKENEVLRQRITSLENQFYNQEQFVAIMEETKTLIDSSGKLAKPNLLLEREIAKQLDLMNSKRYHDSSIYARQNKDILLLLYVQIETSKQLMQANEAVEETNKLKVEINELTDKLEQANLSLAIYQKDANFGND